MSRKCLPWCLHGALILAAAVAVSGFLGNLWLFALFIVGFVLVMVLMLHIMGGGSPTDGTDEPEAQIVQDGDYTAISASKGLRRHR
jgi:hypothetical protein